MQQYLDIREGKDGSKTDERFDESTVRSQQGQCRESDQGYF